MTELFLLLNFSSFFLPNNEVGVIVMDKKCAYNISADYFLGFVNKLYSYKTIFLNLRQMST